MKLDKKKIEEVLIRDCGLSRKRSNSISIVLAGSDILSENKKEKVKIKDVTEVKEEVKTNDI